MAIPQDVLSRFDSTFAGPAPVGGSPSFLDYAKALASGGANVVSSIGQGLEFVDPDLGGPVRELGQQGEDYWQNLMTPIGRAVASGSRLSQNPVSTIGMAALQSAPGIVAMGIPGLGFTRGFEALGAGAKLAGALGASTAEGLYSGASNATSQTQEALDTLARTHPEMSPAQRYQIANTSASQVALTTGPWDFATSMLTGGGALGPLLGRLTKTGAADPIEQGLAKTILKGIGAEGAQEFVQSGGEQALQNMAATSYDPSRSLMDGVLNQALVGGGAGGLTGGAMGGIHGVLNAAARSADDVKQQNDQTLRDLEAKRQADDAAATAAAESAKPEENTATLQQTSEPQMDMLAINPFDVGGHVSAFGRGEDTSVSEPQMGLFGGGGFAEPVASPQAAPSITPITDMTALAPLMQRINENLGIGRAPATTAANVNAALSEPSGTFANAADTQNEVQLDAGQRMAAQLPQEPASVRPKILDVALNRKWGLTTSEEAHPLPRKGPKNYVLLDGEPAPLPVGDARVKAAGYTPEDLKAWYRTPPSMQGVPIQQEISTPLADTQPTEIQPGKEVIQREEQTQAAPESVPATQGQDTGEAGQGQGQAANAEGQALLTPSEPVTAPTQGERVAEQQNLPDVRKPEGQVPVQEVQPQPVAETQAAPAPAPIQPKSIKAARVPSAKALLSRVQALEKTAEGKSVDTLRTMREDLEDKETAGDPETRADIHRRLTEMETPTLPGTLSGVTGANANWQAVQDTVRGADSLGEALDALHKSDYPSAVEKALIRALRGVRNINNVGFSLSDKLADAGVTLGHYHSSSNSIEVHHGGGTQNIIHEALHAVAARALVYDTKFRTHMESLLEQAKASMPAGEYGLTNIHEFVSEAFSNPEFQKALAGIESRSPSLPAKLNTLWSHFVDMIRSFVGASPDMHSVLDEVLQATAERAAADAPSSLGTFRGQSWDTTAETAIGKLPRDLQGPIQKLVDNITTYAKKGFHASAFGHDLAEWNARILPSAPKHQLLVDQKGAKKTQLLQKLDKLLARFDAFKPGEKHQMQSFIKQATISQKWGYAPEWQQDAKVDDEQAAKLAALPANAQQLVKDIFQYQHETGLERINVKKDAVNNEAASQLAGAQGDKEKTEIEGKQAVRLRELDGEAHLLDGPYAPLTRLGNWLVVAKSQDFAEKEAAVGKSEASQKDLDAMKTDPVHYFVRAYETPGEAKAKARQLSRAYTGSVETMEKEVWSKSTHELPFEVMQRLKSMLDGLDGAENRAALESMKNLASDLYLSSLSESSARKAELRRLGVAGADDDIMRSIAVQGQANAHFIATLLHNKEIQDSLQALRDEARDGTEGDRLDRSMVFNEFLKRQMASMNFMPTPIQDKLARFTFNWMLMASPSYLVQNLTQPFMMTAPMLEGRFGFGKGIGTLASVYKELRPIFDGIQAVDPTRFANKIGRETEMLKTMQDRGRIDTNLVNDIGSWANVSKTEVGKRFASAMRKMSNAMSVAEAVNRVTSAVAAYRLDYQSNVAKLGADAAHAHATEYADQIIQTTHGNYDSTNAPRWMMPGATKIPGVKLLAQFRKFQLIQLSMMARILRDSFQHADPEERAVARRALGYVFAHHAVMTGAMGVPFFAVVAPLLGLALGGDEEPDDAEFLLRRAIGNDELSDLLLHGVPGALGVNLTNKIGAGQMTSVLPFTNVDLTNRQGLAETGLALMGPFIGGLLPRAVDGVNMMRQGDYYKGLEQLSPQAFNNALKAYRFATEGVTLRNGDMVLAPDEISLLSASLQAMGFPTNEISDRQLRQSILFDFQKQLQQESGDLVHRYTAAAKDGDTEEQAALRDRWQALQDARTRNGFSRQSVSALTRAPAAQAKRERTSMGGVEAGQQNRGFVDETAGVY